MLKDSDLRDYEVGKADYDVSNNEWLEVKQFVSSV